MSILSSTKAGKSFYTQVLVDWYIKDCGIELRHNLSKECVKVVEDYNVDHKLAIIDYNNYVNLCTLKGLPKIPKALDPHLLYKEVSGCAKQVELISLEHAKIDTFDFDLGASSFILENCEIGCMKDLDVYKMRLNFGRTTGLTTYGNKIDSIENCKFYYFSTKERYMRVYGASNDNEFAWFSSFRGTLDNFHNCEFETMSIDTTLLGGQDVFDGFALNQNANEMLDRFYTTNKCSCLILKTTTPDDEIINSVISKDNGRYVLNR